MSQNPRQVLANVVNGGVKDALFSHPDYLTPRGRKKAADAISKRVIGQLMSFAEQSARGRARVAKEAGGEPLRHQPSVAKLSVSESGRPTCRSPAPHCRIGKWYPKSRSRYRSAGMFPIKTAQLMREVGEGRTQPQFKHGLAPLPEWVNGRE